MKRYQSWSQQALEPVVPPQVLAVLAVLVALAARFCTQLSVALRWS